MKGLLLALTEWRVLCHYRYGLNKEQQLAQYSRCWAISNTKNRIIRVEDWWLVC
jgi:hypothetical protein